MLSIIESEIKKYWLEAFMVPAAILVNDSVSRILDEQLGLNHEDDATVEQINGIEIINAMTKTFESIVLIDEAELEIRTVEMEILEKLLDWRLPSKDTGQETL